MKEIRLQSLTLESFKGVRKFTLDASGQNTYVRGDNATGKTTLFDAWTWLLADRDSADRAAFEIKTLQPDGEPVHHTEHAVQAELTVDGKPTTLRKVYKEKWTKKRGYPTPEQTGHTTDHYVNGVPILKKDYLEFLAQLIDPSAFRLLTDPLFFNRGLEWQERRSLLLDVCGDVLPEDVLAARPELEALAEVLGERSIDDHRKVTAARMREINEKLESIPVRIDEVRKGTPEAPARVRGEIEAVLARVDRDRDAAERERAEVLAGGTLAEARRRRSELLDKMAEHTRAESSKRDGALSDLQDRRRAIQKKIDALEQRVRVTSDVKRQNQDAILDLEEQMAKLRAEFQDVSGWQLAVDGTCSVCGQLLPESEIQKATEEFNANRASRLGRINEKGKALAAQVDERRSRIADGDAGIQEAEADLASLKAEMEQIDAQEEMLAGAKPEPDGARSEEYSELEAQAAQLQSEITAAETDRAGAVETIDARISDLAIEFKEGTAQIAALDAIDAAEKRVAELELEQKIAATEFERLERERALCDKFIVAKIELLDEKINQRFELARFRMAREQQNGGIEERCDTTLNGVPFEDLNHGAQMNVGLDIIRTLQAHYGVEAPVWIDNAESIVDLLKVPAQTIRLVVDGSSPQLAVELRERAPA